jgi:DNA-binding NtrC family response regulator
MAAFLIVDEDRNFREALAIALRLDGHAAQVASTADEAVLHLAARRYTFCVIDAHLWNSDRVVEAAGRTGAAVVLTGPHADLVATAVRRHPAARALPKPFGAEALVALAA